MCTYITNELLLSTTREIRLLTIQDELDIYKMLSFGTLFYQKTPRNAHLSLQQPKSSPQCMQNKNRRWSFFFLGGALKSITCRINPFGRFSTLQILEMTKLHYTTSRVEGKLEKKSAKWKTRWKKSEFWIINYSKSNFLSPPTRSSTK